MKLQYLGTAAAEGIPGLFCGCETCRIAREKGGRDIRSRSQAIVNDTLLIDFPCDTFLHSIRFGIDLSQIKHCLITHIHGDHLYPTEFEYLRSGFCRLPETYGGFHLYGSADAAEKMNDTVRYAGGNLICHVVNAFEPFHIGDLKITALQAKHGTAHPFIYMIEQGQKALLYGHDTDLFPEETWEYLKRAGIVFRAVSLDCTEGAHEELGYEGHMCLGRNVNCRQKMLDLGMADGDTVFVLNHFSHNGLNVNYDRFREIAEPLHFATSYDGMTVEL